MGRAEGPNPSRDAGDSPPGSEADCLPDSRDYNCRSVSRLIARPTRHQRLASCAADIWPRRALAARTRRQQLRGRICGRIWRSYMEPAPGESRGRTQSYDIVEPIHALRGGGQGGKWGSSIRRRACNLISHQEGVLVIHSQSHCQLAMTSTDRQLAPVTHKQLANEFITFELSPPSQHPELIRRSRSVQRVPTLWSWENSPTPLSRKRGGPWFEPQAHQLASSTRVPLIQ